MDPASPLLRVRYRCPNAAVDCVIPPVSTTVGLTFLVIQFGEIFLRQPVAPEHDIPVSRQWMDHISRIVWAELEI